MTSKILPNFQITKDNLDFYLFELSKEVKKLSAKGSKFEIILVGGASVIINYSFRTGSYDVDAYYQSDIMKQAILNVADKLSLPPGWLNNDFIRTKSFSTNIIQYSKFYKEYNNCLIIRTIESEFLVAMKLMAFRKYKNDITDIVGVIVESKLSFTQVKNAVVKLYGTYDSLGIEAKKFIEKYYKC